MASLAFLTFALLAGSAYSAPQASRIVGGSETTIDQYPFLLAVESRDIMTGMWSQTCAANILTNFYAVSAASCFTGIYFNIAWRFLRAGATYSNTGGQLVQPFAAYNHPSYGDTDFGGDISVIRFSSALTWSANVQPIQIVPQGYEFPDNIPVVHVGWGLTEQGRYSDVLRDVTVLSVNRELCAERYQTLANPMVLTNDVMCTGLLGQGGRDACAGDNGGPVYFGNFLIGIVSWSHTCGDSFIPRVNTAIGAYTNWIMEATGPLLI